MIGLFFQSFSFLLRWTVYLALTGQLVTVLPNMEEKAFKSVTTGLMSLGNLNRSLHNSK